MSNAPPLRATGITKRYGSHTVLERIELQVGPSETVVLVGPNGIGKSTLIGCVCGTVIPDAGTIELGGHDLRREPIAARSVLRYLPQEVEVPAGLTGRELLQFYAEVHQDAVAASRAAELSRLGDALDRYATTYSVGMRRQLAFAGLTPGDSRLLVLDEPFAGVDRDGRARMLDVLQQRLASGTGILMAAHDQDARELEVLEARRIDLREVATRNEGGES